MRQWFNRGGFKYFLRDYCRENDLDPNDYDDHTKISFGTGASLGLLDQLAQGQRAEERLYYSVTKP